MEIGFVYNKSMIRSYISNSSHIIAWIKNNDLSKPNGKFAYIQFPKSKNATYMTMKQKAVDNKFTKILSLMSTLKN